MLVQISYGIAMLCI